MEKNKAILFKEGHKMSLMYVEHDEVNDSKGIRDVDKNVTAIECLNEEYGKECPGDWLYNVTYDNGKITDMFIHNHIIIK